MRGNVMTWERNEGNVMTWERNEGESYDMGEE